MMSRRPPQPQTEEDRLARMAPGGRMWSESPIRRPYPRVRQMGAPVAAGVDMYADHGVGGTGYAAAAILNGHASGPSFDFLEAMQGESVVFHLDMPPTIPDAGSVPVELRSKDSDLLASWTIPGPIAPGSTWISPAHTWPVGWHSGPSTSTGRVSYWVNWATSGRYEAWLDAYGGEGAFWNSIVGRVVAP